VKNSLNLKVFGVAALAAASLVTDGCSSAPDLTETQAQALIQAKYDATAPVGANVLVNNQGMLDGITAKYWTRTTIYPNKYWADFTLTPDGKKVLSLVGGGDVIKWRPDSATDDKYSIVVVTAAANHLRAHDVTNIQDEVLPGASKAKGATFTESVNLDGVPAPLASIAHNVGNKLSNKRQADFVLDGGAWKLQSIE
jgi:hypothetical protein